MLEFGEFPALETPGSACATMGPNRVEVRTDPRNAASRRLLLRLGFRLEGTLRETSYLDGRYADDMVLGLLRREWQARPWR